MKPAHRTEFLTVPFSTYGDYGIHGLNPIA
ncbi:hypothetical protein ACVII0_005116 [Sinorhizobium meliloti]